MNILAGILIGTQLVFTIVAGLYFYTNLKTQQSGKSSIQTSSAKEMERIKRMRNIQLSKPLTEKTRPKSFYEIVGQEKGIKALKAAMCGENPQHVIIYGPPGVGKTAAARIILEYAKNSIKSPFQEGAPFIEMDATILQFDERSIADPLIGSVHDPIYQGAGAYGQAGIPQPKEGAVTKAHGGILFIDEIGELHPIQMNKLLKVLEDRKVFLNSSYYTREDSNIPKHVHDIFENGLPADFRLIGATTRSPEEIPPALRSRCTEVFFRALMPQEVSLIAVNACKRIGVDCQQEVVKRIAQYAENGRDTVNMVQMACSIAALEDRKVIHLQDIEEVVEYGRYSPKPQNKVSDKSKIGVVNGLAVVAGGSGSLLQIEAAAQLVKGSGKGMLTVTGIVEEEELEGRHSKMKRPGTARNSIQNVLTILKRYYDVPVEQYDIHVNFPGGMPVDGPSAGTAMLAALYSAIYNLNVPPTIAITGEVSITGRVMPVGGVQTKIEAAVEAGVKKVFIPKANMQVSFEQFPIEVLPVDDVKEFLRLVFEGFIYEKIAVAAPQVSQVQIASAIKNDQVIHGISGSTHSTGI